jgi:hypothetical protein
MSPRKSDLAVVAVDRLRAAQHTPPAYAGPLFAIIA